MHALEDSKRKKRLIVLLPDCMTAGNDLARKIYWMAVRENLPVLYLYQVRDPETELSMARCIATIKAVTAANRLQVEAQPVAARSWVQVLQTIARPGDYVVWQDQHTNSDREYPAVPVADLLSGRVQAPFDTPNARNFIQGSHKPRVIRPVMSIIGYLVIIAVFTWVEIYFDLHVQGPVQKGLLILAVSLEFTAIWAWFQFDYHHSD